MSDASFIETLLQDPLSSVARKDRNKLLLAALIGVVIAKAKVIPTKIVALGIEFTSSDRSALLGIMAVVVGYFLLSFIVYGWYDVVHAFVVAGRANVREISRLEKRHPGEKFGTSNTPRFFSLARALLVELALPVVAGIYALFALYRVG